MKFLLQKLILIVLLLGSFLAKAGDKEKLGIRAGYHHANVYVNDAKADSLSAIPGFYLGVYKDHKLSPFLFLGTGLEYFQNGTNLKDEGLEHKFIVHTASIPLNFKAKVGPAYAVGGVAVNFRLADQQYYDGIKTEVNEAAKTNWMDTPVFVGAGFKFLMFSVEARYHWGMLDIYDDTNYRHRYLQVGATVSF